MTKVLFVLLSLCIFSTSCDLQPKPPTDSSYKVAEAQAAGTKAQAEVQVEFQKRVTSLQLEVAKMCLAEKHTPIFVNSNVDCKK